MAALVKELAADPDLMAQLLRDPTFQSLTQSLAGLSAADGAARPAEAFGRAVTVSDITPSERWAERTTGRKENPAAFIRRVYAKELAEGGLTRPLLRSIDLRLAEAFDRWVQRHPEDAQILPARKRAVLLTEAERKARRREATAARVARYRQRRIP